MIFVDGIEKYREYFSGSKCIYYIEDSRCGVLDGTIMNRGCKLLGDIIDLNYQYNIGNLRVHKALLKNK